MAHDCYAPQDKSAVPRKSLRLSIPALLSHDSHTRLYPRGVITAETYNGPRESPYENSTVTRPNKFQIYVRALQAIENSAPLATQPPPSEETLEIMRVSQFRANVTSAHFTSSYINLFDLVSRAWYAISHFRFARAKIVNWAYASRKFASNITNDISHPRFDENEIMEITRSKLYAKFRLPWQIYI